MIEVCHIDMFNPNTQLVETLRITSSEDYIANGVSYLPILSQKLDYNVSLFDRGTTQGAVTVGLGTIVATNANGELDQYRSYGFDGRTISVYKPQDKYDAVTDSTNVFLTGIIAYVEFGWTTVTFYIKSKLEALNVPMQPTSLAGTNLGTGGAGYATGGGGYGGNGGVIGGGDLNGRYDGYEGSLDMTGRAKPQTFGRVSNAEGVLVNQFYLTWAFNYDYSGNRMPIYRVYNVYVKGIRYPWNGADYATVALLQAATIRAGFYATCLSEGLIRLGSIPASNGKVVVDLADAPDPLCTVGQVVQRVFQRNTTYLPLTDYDAAQLNALDAYDITPVGVYISDNTTTKADVINRFLDSIGAWFAPNSQGVFKFGYIDFPDNLIAAGNPSVAIITKEQWGDDIERLSVEDQSENIPAYAVNINHTHNWAVQDNGSLADAVGMGDRQFFTQEWRVAKAKDSPTLIAHPLAPTLTYDTWLNSQIIVPLLNGDFSVLFASPGNGWTLSGTPTSSVQAVGGVTLVPNGSNIASIAQNFIYRSDVSPGVIELIFTVSASVSAKSVRVSVVRNPLFTPVTLFTGVFNSTPQDVIYIQQFTLPDGLSQPAGQLQVIFATTTTLTQAAFKNVSMRMLQQGGGPDGVAARRLAVQKGLQERYQCSVSQNFYIQNGIDIGTIVTLQDDKRFGLEDGKAFVVIGADPSEEDFKVMLDVWRVE